MTDYTPSYWRGLARPIIAQVIAAVGKDDMPKRLET